jgi:DNA polymerase-3 subunit delta'
MITPLYPWQEAAWLQLQQLRGRLPHAILFHGAAGIGKTAFAERVGQSLLCQSSAADGQPCGVCASCGWFEQYGHPDYRRVRPEILEGGEDEGEEVSEGGTNSADDKKSAKAAKSPSKEIKIDQIRALADFMNISTHRQGMRVIVLYPAEALNTAAANALLKMLEEPPPSTVFLLVTNSLDRLLPTILSRCRQFALNMPPREQALKWLQGQRVDDAEMWLAEQGGAPLAALAQAQSDNREAIDEFLRHLAQPTIEGALKTADKLKKASVPDMVSWLQRWQYDMFSHKLSGTIRYYPGYRTELAALAGRVELNALSRALKNANERRAIAEHPLSAKLFIEDMLLDYSTLFS